MGFSTTINPFTNREVLSCDFCGKSNWQLNGYASGKKTWVKKIACPYGYCQAWATCNECHNKGKDKEYASCGFGDEKLDKNHNGCRVRMEEKRVRA